MKLKNINIYLLGMITALSLACNVSETTLPRDTYASTPPVPQGTTEMQAIPVYPQDTGANIPVDAGIVVSFSMVADATTVSTASSNVTINGTISGPIAYTDPPADGRVLTFQPIVDFAYLETITVTLNTGVSSTTGEPLDQVYTWTFDTGLDSSANYDPRVLAGSQYPPAGATGIDIDTYVDVTFSEPVLNVDNTTFTLDDLFNGIPVPATVAQVGTTNTYRLTPSASLLYYSAGGDNYRVTLTNAITDVDSNLLVLDGQQTWTFRTRPDPASSPTTIADVEIEPAGSTSVWIYFNTDLPVDISQCYIRYDTTSGAFGSVTTAETDWDGDGNTSHLNHRIEVNAPLTTNTLYYFQVWVDIDDDTIFDNPGDLFTTESTFITITTTAVGGRTLTDVAGNQDGFTTVQLDSGASYVFWVSGAADIQGQYFISTGAPQWGADGTDITNDGNTYDAVTAVQGRNSSTNNETVVISRNSATNVLYAKMAYNNAGSAAFTWGGPAGGAGTSLGSTTQAGSAFSACLVYDLPAVKATGLADMPADGVETDLLYDVDTDFSSFGALDFQDRLVIDNGGINWPIDFIINQSATPSDIFRYVLSTDPAFSINLNLGAISDYYLLDADVVINDNASSSMGGVPPYTFDVWAAAPGASFGAGDIIRDTAAPPDEFGIVVSISGSWPYTIEVDRDINISVGNSFRVYNRIAGPLASEQVYDAGTPYYPLWDQNPSANFNPGVNVLTDDIVVNENDNTVAATKSEVYAVSAPPDSNYALRINDNIMDNQDRYAILELPAGSSYVTVGYSTATPNFRINDTNNNFTAASVQPGDIIYNIDQNRAAEILSVIGASSCALSGDIFNATNEKYIIYRSKGFFVAYIDASDDVIARVFNIDGSGQVTGPITVATSGVAVYRNPVCLSDGTGNAMVFYEDDSNNIHAKSYDYNGNQNWSSASILSGYTIVQVVSDWRSDNPSGAYLLAEDGAGNIRLLRINGVTGVTTWTRSLTGYDPHISVDRLGGAGANVLISYLATHTVSTITYTHVRIWGLNSANAQIFATRIITNNTTAAYDCQFPKIVVGESSTTATDTFYVTWYDGRYYSSAGYAIMGRRFNSDGSDNWTSDIFISSPTSYGITGELEMELLFYDNSGSGTAPYDILPIWLDFRDYAATGTNIYYETVWDTGIIP